MLTGTVTDANGVPVQSAAIEIIDGSLGGQREIIFTNAQGRFSWWDYGPGSCFTGQGTPVLIRKGGFETYVGGFNNYVPVQIQLSRLNASQ
jgi:hypothetical protein